MVFVPWSIGAGAVPSNAICAAGYRGGGTANSPCIAANGPASRCSMAAAGNTATFDSQGNVTVYLDRAQAPSY